MTKKMPPVAFPSNAAPARSQPTDALPRKLSGFGIATGTESPAAQSELLAGVIRSVRVSGDPAEVDEQTDIAVALLEGIKPQDELEGMLAAQMVATHKAAMDCMAAAARVGSMQVKEIYFRHSAKLLNMCLKQVDALDKHRGRLHSSVSVGQLVVQQGGQSVMVNVQMTPTLSPPDRRVNIEPLKLTTKAEPARKRSRRSDEA